MARVAEIIVRLKAQGAETLGKLSSEVQRLSGAVRATEAPTAAAAGSLDKFRGRADAAGDVASKLAQAIGIISPEAQALATTFADLGDGAVGLADAAKASGVSLTTLAAAGVGLAAGLAVVGGAYVHITREMEREAAQAAINRQANDLLTDSARDLADAQLDAAVAFGTLTEAQAAQERIARGAQRGVQDFGASLKDQRAELRATIESSQQLADLGSTGLLDWIPGVEATVNAADAIFGWTDSANAAKASLDVLSDAEEKRAADLKAGRQLQQDVALVEGEVAKGRERTATATVAASTAEADRARLLEQVANIADRGLSAEALAAEKARRELAALRLEAARLKVGSEALAPAIAQLEAELGGLAFDSALAAASAEFEETFAPIPRARSELEGFYEELAGIVPPEALTDMEQLALLAGDLNSALASGRISADEFTAASEALAAAQGAAGEAAAMGPDSRAGKVSSAVSTVAGGASAIMGASAAAGPVGMIVAAVVSLVSAIGDGLLEDLGGVVMGLLDTVGNIGPILIDFLSTTLEPLLVSIFENAALLVEGVLGVLVPELLILLADVGLWKAVGEALARAVVDILIAALAFVVETVGMAFGSVRDTVEFIRDVFSRDFWQGIAEDAVAAFKEAFTPEGRERRRDRRQEAGGDVGSFFADAFAKGEQSSVGLVGSFAKGSDYVPRDGLAMVHKGERIERADDARRGGGAGVTVNVSGLFLGRPAELGAELNRRFKRYNVAFEGRS